MCILVILVTSFPLSLKLLLIKSASEDVDYYSHFQKATTDRAFQRSFNLVLIIEAHIVNIKVLTRM